MAYTSVTEVKQYLGISVNTDDLVLAVLIDAAQSFIESYTGRRFEPYTATIMHTGSDIYDDALSLRDDLLSLTSITINGTSVDISGAVLLGGLHGEPYYGIRLDAFEGYHSDDDVIQVTGQWGYGLTVPADIVQACTRLAAYYYRQRDAQVFDTTAMPGAGVITVPRGMPADVQKVLDRYRMLI
jgi:hypothetical protein